MRTLELNDLKMQQLEGKLKLMEIKGQKEEQRQYQIHEEERAKILNDLRSQQEVMQDVNRESSQRGLQGDKHLNLPADESN